MRVPKTRVVPVLVSLCVMTAALLGFAGPAHAGPNEGDLFGAVNGARASSGLPAYSYAADLTAAARGQAERMAASGELYHNPDLGSEVGGWSRIGENVAYAGDWRSAHQVLMNSPDHRAQILDPGYTQMGVGTAVSSDGTLWVAQVFRTPTGASTPSAGGSTTDGPASTSTPASPPAASAPAPTPEQLLRQHLRDAREKVQAREKGRRNNDPVVAALDFSTVMSTVSR